MADPSVIDPQELELFPKCETCDKNNAGLHYCQKPQCPNNGKYCCIKCNDNDDIHDHKMKRT